MTTPVRRGGAETRARSWFLVLAAFAPLLASCGGASSPSSAPKITVVTGLYPLAEAASQIGLGAVNVVDVVPPGANPLTYTLTPAQVNQVSQAAVALQADPSLQPSFSAAAAHGHAVTISPVAGDAEVWLNPFQWESAVGVIARALIAANPAAAGDYRNGEADFTDQLESVD
ncbi:MAG: metal ABC transporter solute-binding protein, Zn/Mn family, partial [Acidimicrobiales bacterium]